jgi:nuclear factor NF-kappa-B p105 subunit
MGIIHTIQKNIAAQLLVKKINEIEYELNEKVSPRREAQLHEQAEKEVKAMNLNQVCLCFKAYSVDPSGHKELICDPVYSTPINNMSKF